MEKSTNLTHPMGESGCSLNKQKLAPLEVDTFKGKVHVEWDPYAKVTPLGQLPFFIEFLKISGLFEAWIKTSPLTFTSGNAPDKRDVLGIILLLILSGHTRYGHISRLKCDTLNPPLLGMEKIVSEDAVRRALLKLDEADSISWLQSHLNNCYQPLLTERWILDVDTTIKLLYGRQEGAVVGYNPHKPGRPSHTYHSYMIANLRSGQLEFDFANVGKGINAYEYSVLVTSLNDEILTVAQLYRDRADSENAFDELKNQWGWCGFATQDIKRCRLMANMIALIYNWWSLFSRLADPSKHTEAITSRPLLLTGVGRQTNHARQTRITISNPHAKAPRVQKILTEIIAFFKTLKSNAEQYTPKQRWYLILSRAFVKYLKGRILKPPNSLLPAY